MHQNAEWHTYTGSYDPEAIRGQREETKPWQLTQIVRSYLPGNARILDVGCGPGTKLPPLAPYSSGVVGIDTEYELTYKAKVLAGGPKDPHLVFANADGNRLPFPSESFDVVTYMLSFQNAVEAHRVLRTGGVVILEHVGERDKRELKELFGSDEQGPRGFLMEYRRGQCASEVRADFERAGFSAVSALEGVFDTWYTRERLERLMKEAPTVRNFDPVADKEVLDKAERSLGTPNGIKVQQHRILVIAKK